MGPGISLLHGIHCECANGVYAKLVSGPAQFVPPAYDGSDRYRFGSGWLRCFFVDFGRPAIHGRYTAIVRNWVAYLTAEKLYGPNDPLFPKTAVRPDEHCSFAIRGLTRELGIQPPPI